ncbi:MAG: RNA pseudouridine synthase [Myxococcales bacterium]|nr:RNA pseudouridine synthase [Myxococcales bacterium]
MLVADAANENDQPVIIGRLGLLYAVYKPAGLRVHPGADDGADDLIERLAALPKAPPGLCPAHRLDAGVSGVVLCSADPEMRQQIGGLLATRQVQKVYLALVFGRAHAKGIIRRSLDDERRGRALPALTRYRRREQLGGFTLLRVVPETGRKHQIRRHLHSIGHPIVGDDRYPQRPFRPVPGYPGRLWLHAWSIELPGGQRWTAPLPAALAAHLEVLRAGSRRDDADEAPPAG